MASDSFVHLHVHSEYSMLDGAAKLADMTKAAAELEMPAIAVTDHGNNYASFEFYKAATAQGIKPIVGLEAYVTPGTARGDRSRVSWGSSEQKRDDVSGGGAYTHMTMWAEDTPGMHNLFRMSSLASIEGYYFKPRMDRELLQTYAKGSSRRPVARPARSRRACDSVSTKRRARRPPSIRTSSARRTTSPRSWSTASRSSGACAKTS